MEPLSIFRRWRMARLWTCLWLLAPFALWGQTSTSNTPLLLPSGIAFDSQGNLYFAETNHHVIRRVDRVGEMTTVAGTGTQGYGGDLGHATSALLDSPQGLAVGASGLYIADTHNHRVRRVDLASGIITTVAGGSTAGAGGDHGPANAATLDRPVAVALDAAGDLFIADSESHRVRRVDAVTSIITTVAGEGTQGYAGDEGQAGSALLDSPQGLAVDANGNLYLSDTHNHRIRRIDGATGKITTVAGTGAFGYAGDVGPAVSARLALPQGLSIDAQGDVYIADAANHRVRRIDAASGVMSTVAGDGTQGFAGDGGAAGSAALDSPRSTALSPEGLVTFADTGNQRVRQVDALSSIQTIAGVDALTPETLSISGDASVAYGAGELTAVLAATQATGTVTFSDQYGGAASTVATMPLSANTAVFDTSQLPVGAHVITASYSGDSSHAAVVSGAFSLTVTKARTATTLAVKTDTLVSASSGVSGQPVLMTAHVASATKGVPTGTVILFDGATLLSAGVAAASGDLNFTTSALGAGPHSLTAAYSGDSNFEGSTSPTALFTVSAPAPGAADFTLAPSGTTTQTIVSGTSADFSFAVQVEGGLSSPVSLAASGLPSLATASFNPGSIPPGTSSATFTMTVATPKTAAIEHGRNEVVFAVLIGIFGIAGRARGRLPEKMFLIFLSVSLMVLAGCGDRIRTGDSVAGPPKSYTITVTGTATDAVGTVLRHTATVTLVVQPAS